MRILKIYQKLFNHFGRQHWWPTLNKKGSQFEIMVGAVLTQQTSWKQVERAIQNLSSKSLLNPKTLSKANIKTVEKLVRSTGFYKQKAGRIVNLSKYLVRNYKGDLRKFFNQPTEKLRKELLSLDGIGKETADSILLYADDRLIFPVDAYTIRLLNRLGTIVKNYDEAQKIFHEDLPKSTRLYNEFHALIVRLGKTNCKTKPECNNCPLTDECKYIKLKNNLVREYLSSR